MTPQRLVLLGATGSIGVNTLDVIAAHPERFSVYGLVAHRQVDRLFEQAQQHFPEVLGIVDPEAWAQTMASPKLSSLRQHYRLHGRPDPELIHNAEEVDALCRSSAVDTVMAAIVGAAGLRPIFAAVQAGKRMLLANKESLVLAGSLLMRTARASGAIILPVDSEHNAIFQAMQALVHTNSGAAVGAGVWPVGVRAIGLTASGGPFLHRPLHTFNSITVAEAVRHPNWSMGQKISVDSATMANKGLELIEAAVLFDVTGEQLSERVRVLIHPQSIVHGWVEMIDGGWLAQLGCPDMRTPIAHALAYPDRIHTSVKALDISQLNGLQFLPVDQQRFPCFALARQAAIAGGAAPAVFNAANEMAVARFLAGDLPFTRIAEMIQEALAMAWSKPDDEVDAVLALDAEVRRRCIVSLN